MAYSHLVRYPSLIHLLSFLVVLAKHLGLVGGAGAAIGVQRLYQKWRQNRALGWPTANATILWGKIRVDDRGFFRNKRWVELTYSYYAGEYRSGIYLRRFRREEDAEEFIRQTKDKQIQVRYNESAPEKSVILDRDLEMIALLTPQMR
jgi:hypothetical protein